MRVRQEKRINGWKVSYGNAGSTYPRKKSTEPRTEMRVGENPNISQLEEKRRMAYVGNAKLLRHLGQRVGTTGERESGTGTR